MTDNSAPTASPIDPPPTPALMPCDIVMAGGVTSGIIYPGAIAKIAQRYSFHSIGGTSVGAIAAAATAAAEYGRRTKRSPGGFDFIQTLPTQLGAEIDGHSRLFRLFTPDSDTGRDTRGLFGLITPVFTAKGVNAKLSGFARFVASERLVMLVVAVTGAVGLMSIAWLVYLGHCLIALAMALPFVVFVLCAGAAALAGLLAWKWLPAWRTNGYGICSGAQPPLRADGSDAISRAGLTPWVHHVIQKAAGRGDHEDPLTFGDLWRAPLPDGTPPQPIDGHPVARSIELAMITSDISRNRAAQLPFLEAPSELYVEEAMLERYFPLAVVDWMRRHPGSYNGRVVRRHGVFRLPKPEDLPLVFAARMSLSFPVLLSAVPLLTPDYAGKEPNQPLKLRSVWFSDGGLTSNFPIHFFDSPIPSRPTFCLNLVDFETELSREPAQKPRDASVKTATQQAEAVQDVAREANKPIAQACSPDRRANVRPDYSTSTPDPRPNDAIWQLITMARRNEMSPAPFTSFETENGSGTISFFANLINTARRWSDNQMLIAPGTRDRVVHIGLRDDEGGLNLDMPPKTIAELDRRGRAAGLLIAARFDPKAKNDPETDKPIVHAFPNHRWVRYRNFMAALERVAAQFQQSRQKSDTEARRRGEFTIDEMIAGQGANQFGYRPPTPSARAYFATATGDFDRFADNLAASQAEHAATFDPSGHSGAAPKPRMRLRQRPVADSDPHA